MDTLDNPNLFELKPEVSPENRQLLIRFRLLSMVGLFVAMLAPAVLGR